MSGLDLPRWATAVEDFLLLGEARAYSIDIEGLESREILVERLSQKKKLFEIQSLQLRTASHWIQKLNLTNHVEGGAFKELYRSTMTLPFESVREAGFPGPRSVSTGIYFLLEVGDFSAFHRIKSDEMWHIYDGCTLAIYEIKPDASLVRHLLGKNVDAGEVMQIVVSANSWFASRVEVVGSNGEGSSELERQHQFALVGCTVAPGFDFEDFELAKRDELTGVYPQHHALIKELTRC